MRIFLILATCCICSAQSLTVGVKVGLRTTEDIGSAATSESKRYIVGPMLDVGLPLGFGVEFDALYSREGYLVGNGNFEGSILSRERANLWEFPLLLKYRIGVPFIKPYVEVGYAPRTINGSIHSDIVSIPFFTGGPPTFSQSTTGTNWKVSQGIVAGGGVQFTVGRVRISPEIRYTHWNNAAISGYFGDGRSYASNQNQLDVFVGLGSKLR